jgi:class 3 adenylate cyclase
MNPDLPTGTVTFLFTDIEGSTKLWQQYPNAIPKALACHHAILKETIVAHAGYVFQIVGDAFCAAFSTATDGVWCKYSIRSRLKAALYKVSK